MKITEKRYHLILITIFLFVTILSPGTRYDIANFTMLWYIAFMILTKGGEEY